MTNDYSHAISWIENHNNPDNYNDNEYEEWLQANKEAFGTPNLFNSPDFIHDLDNLWNTYHNEEPIESEPMIDSKESTREQLRGSSITTDTIITSKDVPVRIQSRSPISITPIEEPRIEEPVKVPVIIATPENIPAPQKQSIFRRFLGLFRRKK